MCLYAQTHTQNIGVTLVVHCDLNHCVWLLASEENKLLVPGLMVQWSNSIINDWSFSKSFTLLSSLLNMSSFLVTSWLPPFKHPVVLWQCSKQRTRFGGGYQIVTKSPSLFRSLSYQTGIAFLRTHQANTRFHPISATNYIIKNPQQWNNRIPCIDAGFNVIQLVGRN